MARNVKSAHEAESIEELVDLLGGNESALRILTGSLKHKEQQRLSHKKAYLRRQTILIKAKEAGITADDEE